MTEQNTIKKAWLINDVMQDFLDFIENYGKIKHGELFRIRTTHRWNLPDYYTYGVTLDYKTVAYIVFEFESTIDGLKVMATMSSDPAANPFTDETLQYFDDMDRAIWKKYRLETVPTSTDELTEQEKIIANLLAKGLSKKEIATELGIEPYTVKTHLYNLKNKWKISERATHKRLQQEALHRDCGKD